MEERYYKMEELAKLLNVKVRTTREWAKLGKIKAVRIPGTKAYRISAEEVKRLLEENEVK